MPPRLRQLVADIILALSALHAASAAVHAGTLAVSVVDPDGVPVPDVAVYVMQDGVDNSGDKAPGRAVMDQVNKQFVPHILVVRKGTAVDFPNSDTVAHHVYSFSKPNDFVLPLYKGDPHDPVTFKHDGIVTLGCNIHDQMLGYIVVVDSDVFGKTGSDGTLTLEVDDAATGYAVSIWSPRIRDAEERLTRKLPRGTATTVRFALEKKLRPRFDPGTDSVEWSAY
jgi:plastocyanin